MLSLPCRSGLSHMTNFSRWSGFAQSLSGSSLRTQGPTTLGLKSEKRPLLQCRNESPRRRDERNCAHAGVPAFAGTTRRNAIHRKIPYAIALTASGRGDVLIGECCKFSAVHSRAFAAASLISI